VCHQGLWLLGRHLSQSLPPLLTLDIFKQRLKNPETLEGKRLINLHNFTIDLRSQNAEFKTQFYQQLKNSLTRPGNPIGLDISHSVVLGEFAGNDLGLRVPLYAESLSPMFTEEELSQIKRDRRRLSQLTQLSRSLLGTPASQVQISVFRGAMKMVQTRFSGSVNFNNTFFLNSLESMGAEFTANSDWSESRFSQGVRFNGSKFKGMAQFLGSIFIKKPFLTDANFKTS
jgi:hypothetical protein